MRRWIQQPRATCERKERVMATRSQLRGGAAARPRERVKQRPTLPTITLSSIAAHRRERAWLALVGIPLALIAAALSGEWLACPPLLAASWWWTKSWRWSWVLALEEGAFGAQWAYTGATGLALFRAERTLVAIVWVAIPAALAVAARRNRERMDRPEWGIRL